MTYYGGGGGGAGATRWGTGGVARRAPGRGERGAPENVRQVR